LNATLPIPDTDLRAVLDIIDDARCDDPGDVVPWALLEGLAELIPCDSVQFCELDWAHEALVAQQYLVRGDERGVAPPGGGEETIEYFTYCRDFLPCSEQLPPAADPHPVRWSDFYSDRELRSTEAYRCYLEPVRRCLSVRLAAPPGRARRVLFQNCSTHDFSDRDVMVLELLRPHLHEIYLDAQRRRAGVPQLTDREWQILGLAGEGLSNEVIGNRLFISSGTVRKHIEHVLEKVGVHSRGEAAAIALPHRPPAGPTKQNREAPWSVPPGPGRSGQGR
jgi:DNA-binding CsgD family transcriptional regulator